MRAEAVADPKEFLKRAAEVLADEARHNLILGVVNTVIRTPEVYPDHRLYLVSDAGRTLAAAAVTAPYNLIVADAKVTAALRPLAAAVVAGADVPGAVGNQPTIAQFVQEWEAASGRRGRLQMQQGVFALRQVATVPVAPGAARIGGPADQELIERWIGEFAAEALPDEPHDEERMRKAIARRLGGDETGACWLWERDGDAVSLSGHGSPTGTGIRVGPVYTPVPLRGNGYASALVATESAWLLRAGYQFCFLYTDLANPTSNAIYERIGYRQIAESATYGFADRD